MNDKLTILESNKIKANTDNSYKISSGQALPLENWDLLSAIKKENIFSKPCPVHKTENLMYCFDCSIPICTYCRQDHIEHCFTVKNNFLLKPQLENFLFDKIDSTMKGAFELSYPRKLYDFFYDKLDKHFKILQESLERYRVQRLKELHIIFEKMENTAKVFNNNYKKCKASFNKFLTESKTFFPNNSFSEVVFLQLFNIVNQGEINEKKVNNEIKYAKQKTVQYEEDLTKALFDVEILFKEFTNKAPNSESLIWLKNENPFEEFSNLVEENTNLIEKFTALVSRKKKKGNTNVSGFDASISMSNVSKGFRNNSTDKKLLIMQDNSPNVMQNKTIGTSRNNKIKFNNEPSIYTTANPNNRSINQMSNATHIGKQVEKDEIILEKVTNLKMYESTYINFLETGEIKFNKLNLKDGANISKIMEATEIFQNQISASKLHKNMNNYLSPQNKISNTYSISNQLLNLLKVYSDLNSNKLKMLRMDNNMLAEGDANYNIAGTSPMSFLEEEGLDYFQALPGTKKIQLYDFQRKKPYVIEIFDLNIAEYGYNYFPYGSRCFYHSDKIYITGGKDMDKEYSVVLLYDISSCKLFRLTDMIYSRCYHSVIFCNERHTLYLIGGESNKTCESLSIKENRTYPMPHLNYPRANSTVYLYKGIYLYVFCGYRTSILEKSINTTFERINLNYSIIKSGVVNTSIEFDIGWEKVSVNNKAGIDLQFEYAGIMPLTDSHIYIYGGYESRKVHRAIVFFDFITHSIMNIDDKEMQDLKVSLLYDPKFNEKFDNIII